MLKAGSSGHALLHQACGFRAIAVSLVACVTSGLVDIWLAGAQSLFSLVPAVTGMLWGVADTVAALLAHILAVLWLWPSSFGAPASRRRSLWPQLPASQCRWLVCAETVTVSHLDVTLSRAPEHCRLHARPSRHRLPEDV